MKNNSLYSPLLIIAVVVILGIFSFIKPMSVFDVNLKQINIFSAIIPDSTLNSLWGQEVVVEFNPEIKDMENLNSNDLDSLVLSSDKHNVVTSSDTFNTSIADTIEVTSGSKLILEDGIKDIQDFSNNKVMKNSFIDRLTEANKRNIRIAVMGDSFIEGDIMTMDLRETFQSEYSGGGVGFMPIVSSVARYRRTIKHLFSDDWKVKSIVKNSKSDDFTLSGLIFIPQEESWVEYQTTNFRKHVKQTNKAQLLFINTKSTIIEVIVNDEEPIYYEPDSSDLLQVITINKSIDKIRYSFSNVDGMSLYGAVLDGGENGVSIDNYSIRGNRGAQMTSIDVGLTAQLSKIMPYDLIILEYGQNIIHKDQQYYNGYDKYFRRIINHIKVCYPNTPILLMGIGDRSSTKEVEVSTFTGVLELDRLQCKAAKESKVLFWSTLSVMHSLGGIAEFVKKGWAAKDYIHLSSKGGKIIATELYNAMIAIEPYNATPAIESYNATPAIDSTMLLVDNLAKIDTISPSLKKVNKNSLATNN